MNDIQKMFQTIINNQSAFRQEMLKKFKEMDEKFTEKFDSLREEMHKIEINLTQRINNIGKQTAYLEDDTPTRDEFDKLEKRVDKIESKSASAL